MDDKIYKVCIVLSKVGFYSHAMTLDEANLLMKELQRRYNQDIQVVKA